ncbi:MAG: hypothetical protein JJ957_14830 [Pseudomonadales bacterium]|nr:hypothetical protein [Pseudomonadales bacterium]MBO6564197.1 hypothetical protein [Pseudomonadales bacterium]MBO6597056.1 hypothetical protein [Pseudomonadales bacterium]MBO6823757.1 hypothetical protein [Pseudomonadales bacterium]
MTQQSQSVSLPLLGFTFMLAFCSMVYELLLGQTLSAFLGNTVLRYSVTIGLYMFSMGIGAFLANERILANPVRSLQFLEIALAILGSVSVPLVFFIDLIDVPALVLSVAAHLLIIVIGVLTGLEIPLLIEVRSEVKNVASRILGVDYIGAFVGTVAFALWFYPKLGIFATAIFTASVNALVGLLLPFYVKRYPDIVVSHRLLFVQAIILLMLLLVFWNYSMIEEAGIERYIGH